MEPAFKIRWPKPPLGADPGEPPVAVIELGDRRITFRAATGEVGEKGPFTYVELEGSGKDPVGFCITQESQFDNLWKFLDETRCR